MTINPPIPCVQEMLSPKNKNARSAVKIGLKLRNTPDVVAPNFWIPMLQRTIHTTVEINPVYKSDSIKEWLTLEIVKSLRLNGNSTRSPNIPEYKLDISGEVVFIAHLLQTE